MRRKKWQNLAYILSCGSINGQPKKVIMRLTPRQKWGLIILNSPYYPEEFEGEVHKKVLRDAGIEAVASLGLPEALHMPENPEGAKQFLFLVLQKLQDAGGTYLCGCIADTIEKFTGQPEWQIVMDTLGDVAANAKTVSMTSSLDLVNRNEEYLYNTLGDAREAILAIKANNLNLHAGTYHMNIEEVNCGPPAFRY
jgi:D-psicose/D-tagatose/L-ribulose 3-epimerase